ncbi:acyl-CoA thioester hydrolase/BAAT C-terminal domain-containing protein [Kineothrix alysoides]|nr:acyl-CoA thioester hydrolase/BAAT C-terminal domain-containing protein [Kineothrix alysoides]
MKRIFLDTEKDGFYGAYYPNIEKSNKAIILMLGDAVDDRMAVSGVKWFQKQGCNVLAMSPAKKDYGHHNYPLERFEAAIQYLKTQENNKIGIAGASTTGMLALVAASYYHDITLTIAITPSDFIMEGFYQDRLDGAHERPGINESSVSYKGKPLPYLPYAYRHPTYWQMIKKESKESGNFIASREMFRESERLHPVSEEEKIKVENIKGKIIFVGAEDDVLWDTCKYIKRMEKRLEAYAHDSQYQSLLYKYGTHFVFPQTMLESIIPLVSGLLIRFAFKSGRQNPSECKKTRMDIDAKLSKAIVKW